ncbi:MAG: hypothetical protein ACK559_31495, partial [bacterium]
LTNDQPMRIHLKVEADIPISKLIQKIFAYRETNLDPTQIKTTVVLFSINDRTHAVKNVFSEHDKLSELDIIMSEFYC